MFWIVGQRNPTSCTLSFRFLKRYNSFCVVVDRQARKFKGSFLRKEKNCFCLRFEKIYGWYFFIPRSHFFVLIYWTWSTKILILNNNIHWPITIFITLALSTLWSSREITIFLQNDIVITHKGILTEGPDGGVEMSVVS